MAANIDSIFKLLDNWIQLPDYQLERRADIYFAMYLPIIIEKHFMLTEKICYEQIIPELPLKQDGNNLSNKVDYAVFCKGKAYFVELKTTMNSIEGKQISYLKKNRDNKLKRVISDLFLLCDAKRKKDARRKYVNLIACLSDKRIDITRDTIPDGEIVVVYMLPKEPLGKTKELLHGVEIITFGDIIKYIEGEDELAKRFCKSLRTWRGEQ